MQHIDPVLAALVHDTIPAEQRWLFIRRVLGTSHPTARVAVRATSSDWTNALADADPDAIFAELRRSHGAAMPRIDAVAAQLVPVEERLRRVVPTVPIHVCRVGRARFVDGLLAHPVFQTDGHLHLTGARQSGRSLVAAQVALFAADDIPVVAWLDGRSAEGLTAGLLQLAADLGLPTGPRTAVLAMLSHWLDGQGDWLVVVDDAPVPLPTALQNPTGRVLTVGVEAHPAAHATVDLPALPPPARSDLVRRWSRGRIQQLDGDLSVSELAVLAAAGSAEPPATVDAAEAVLSADARALLGLTRAYARAAIPLPLLQWPEGATLPEQVPVALESILRSTRASRAAATELVRAARAQWVGDALLVARVGRTEVTDPRTSAAAAAVVVQALHRHDQLPLAWSAHVGWLSDDPRVPDHLRRALAVRSGRLALRGGDPEGAVEWFQRALAALDTHDSARAATEAALLNDLGVAWRRCGRLDEAASVLRDALQREQACDPVDPLALATTQANLGHVLREQQAVEEARTLYESAYHTRRESLGAHHRDTAAVAIQLGVVRHRLGAVSAAQQAWSEAVRGLSLARPREPGLLARALTHLARLECDLGDIAVALRHAERARALLVALHDDVDHPAVVELRTLLTKLDARVEAER